MARSIVARGWWLPGACIGVLAIAVGQGCETDSFLDPSRTGYFEFAPTTMPVLKRLDVIEQASFDNAIVGPPEPEDLIPGSAEYILGPGDVVRVEIYELVNRGETDSSIRTIDPDGYIRVPVLGSVPAAGLTLQQLTESIKERLVKQNIILNRPIVNITPEETSSYQYKVMGSVERGGLFALSRPDLRLSDALALAQGAYPTTQTIRIIRTVQDVRTIPQEQGPSGRPPTAPPTATTPPTAPPVAPATPPKSSSTPPDIESLIDQLNQDKGAAKKPATGGAAVPPAAGSATPPSAPVAPPAGGPAPPPAAGNGAASKPSPGALRDTPSSSPGMMRQAAPIDIDTLEPVRVADAPTVQDARRQSVTAAQPNDGSTFVFDQDKQEWVRVRAGTAPPPGAAPQGAKTGAAAAATRKDQRRPVGPPTRVIEIPYADLLRGVPGLDVIIRPGDTIIADAGDRGVVYIDGEVIRPGVYQLPDGGRLTVSRLIAAAGGLNQVAIPERCDLTRNIGDDREATIRFSLAAIRSRGEPDIYMKPDDHVIIGTNFWATPLAVVRNGFRMTYGFGFLLDRNFGNDVFGPPPVNVVGE